MNLERRRAQETSPSEAANGKRLELIAAAEWYRLQLGWPVAFDASHCRLVMRTGETVDAITMPDWLASSVALHLEQGLLAGPISIDTTRTWWTILSAPCGGSHADISPELRSCRVHVVPHGGQVVLPHPHDTRHWRRPPNAGTPLPPWKAVITATNRSVQQLR
ncbi:hypothetical protein F1721_33010 [Saccharopolyspora hirsuta]|uniref:Uncharacterized protein n=1 Tax=Saccharopolyspora hirsuta TaxID=1837 RepID=A0A5M7BB18_SACHI|nr:hypothetical protein [Saccharopolyspora hirsuta]KAA5825457.1 hypothetical protein F1721_33010 [Saccharopolyspora hirsuta]